MAAISVISVLAQLGLDDELVGVDDGSTDDNPAVRAAFRRALALWGTW